MAEQPRRPRSWQEVRESRIRLSSAAEVDDFVTEWLKRSCELNI